MLESPRNVCIISLEAKDQKVKEYRIKDLLGKDDEEFD
jgi:hypothetical protein